MINESKVASIKNAARVIAATVMAFVIITSVFAGTAFADMVNEYNVVINDNGNEQTITTDEKEPIEILNEAHIALGTNDKLDISAFEAGNGGTIVIDRLNQFNIKTSEAVTSYDVYANTVGEAFAELGIDVSGCELNYEADDAVVNGMVVDVVLPYSVTVKADGAQIKIGARENHTVKDALILAGVSLEADDYTNPELSSKLTNGMTVEVFRVSTKTVTVDEKIAFKTTQKKDGSMNRGASKVEVKGVNGEKTVTYEVKYVNGREVKRTELSSVTTKKPVNKVERVGTKPIKKSSNGVQSKNGYYVGQVIDGKYTHYCACAKCCGDAKGITASGKKIKNGMANPYYIACNWLPLGSVVEVDGVQYTVADRGGSGLSKKGRIDIYTPEGHAACYRYGTGKCTLRIVRLGW